MQIIETNLPTNGSFSRRNKTDEIILHHAEASHASVEEVNRWHLECGWTGIGYHFYIRKDGKVYRGRPEWAVGAHAQGYNSRAIGICVEGSYMTETMPQAQFDALVGLVREEMAKYPGAKVLRHRDVNSTDCPGDNFPWQEVKARVYSKTEAKKEEHKVTYKEFCAFMARYQKDLETKNASAWAEKAWEALMDAGITDGSAPQAPLTREQLAVMLRRLGLIGKGAK